MNEPETDFFVTDDDWLCRARGCFSVGGGFEFTLGRPLIGWGKYGAGTAFWANSFAGEWTVDFVGSFSPALSAGLNPVSPGEAFTALNKKSQYPFTSSCLNAYKDSMVMKTASEMNCTYIPAVLLSEIANSTLVLESKWLFVWSAWAFCNTAFIPLRAATPHLEYLTALWSMRDIKSCTGYTLSPISLTILDTALRRL